MGIFSQKIGNYNEALRAERLFESKHSTKFRNLFEDNRDRFESLAKKINEKYPEITAECTTFNPDRDNSKLEDSFIKLSIPGIDENPYLYSFKDSSDIILSFNTHLAQHYGGNDENKILNEVIPSLIDQGKKDMELREKLKNMKPVFPFLKLENELSKLSDKYGLSVKTERGSEESKFERYYSIEGDGVDLQLDAGPSSARIWDNKERTTVASQLRSVAKIIKALEDYLN